MADINLSIGYIFGNEGGYAEPPRVETPTNMGITLKDLREHRSKGVEVTAEDVKLLTKMEATDIYKAKYWDVMRLDQVTDQNTATAIMDVGVLHGPGISIKFAQKVCLLLGFFVATDGVNGEKTLFALNHVYRNVFIRRFEMMVYASFQGIIAQHPEDEKYRQGWDARTARLLVLV